MLAPHSATLPPRCTCHSHGLAQLQTSVLRPSTGYGAQQAVARPRPDASMQASAEPGDSANATDPQVSTSKPWALMTVA